MTALTVKSFKGRFDRHRSSNTFKKQNAWTATLRTENQSTCSLPSRLKGDDDDIREKREENERVKEGGEREKERENSGTDDSTQLAHMSSLCSESDLLNRENHLRHLHSRMS